ncbi:MAG: DUF2269 family protein, partial [Acidobacteria bacterium]|nr:DUF2269 family protein [Acidobacteriota bacterium]MCI0668267.1 DUF2269 family protein [Methylococcaceae bacterium]
MTYPLLKFVHVLGAVSIGGGLIGVWVSDLRSRQVHQLPQFAEAVRNIAGFYDGVVVPGALLLLIFPDDQISDRPERFFAAEIIREKLIRRLSKELP